MSKKLFEGKTQAQWLLLRSPSRDLDWKFAVSQLKVQEALLWFADQERQEVSKESRLQFRIAQSVSVVAIVLTFLAWWFPREPQASGHKEPDTLLAPKSPATNTQIFVLPALTNSSNTTKTNLGL
jgi:hypothetical protein